MSSQVDVDFVISFLKIFTFLCICVVTGAEHIKTCNDTEEKSNGIGTVLFTPADVYKQCWSQEEIAILNTRMILEDLLPDVSILSINSNDYVEDIVGYFRLLIEVVKKATHGRKKRITLLALTDILGGYLQYAVLPIARYAFYAGLIDYNRMEKLIQLFEELKWFLRTNGQGWPKPMKHNPSISVEAINFDTELPKTNNCCNKLIFYETERRSENENDTSAVLIKSEITFPLPFFDSKVRPSSIAVPFKRYPLRNIESRKASHLVMKFFIGAVQCLKEKKTDKRTDTQFQNTFYSWLTKEVLPKIEDDKFYSAFGGVLRIEETLKSMGATANYNYTSCLSEGEHEIDVPETGSSHKHTISTVILTIMLIAIILWFIIGTVFICYRMRKHRKKSNISDSPKTTGTEASKWSLFSKSKSASKSDQSSICKCHCSTKSTPTPYSSSFTSDYEIEESVKKRKQKHKDKSVTICYPPFMAPYSAENKPAIIETKTTMKKLPSIEEISEITTEPRSQYAKVETTPHSTPIRDSTGKNVSKRYTANLPYKVVKMPCEDVNMSGSASTSRSKLWNKNRTVSGLAVDECWCDILHEEEEGEGIEALTADDSYLGNKEDGKLKERIQIHPSLAQARSLSKEPSFERSSVVKQSSSERNTLSKKLSVEKSESTEKIKKSLEFSFKNVYGETDESETKHSIEIEPPDNHGSFLEGTAEEQEILSAQLDQVVSPDQTQQDISTADETSEVVEKEGASPHTYACHSSLTGAYANQLKSGKGYIFGYDFQTSSSSDLSEEETYMKTSTSM